MPRNLISAPEGGRIKVMSISVNARRAWKDVVSTDAPETPVSDPRRSLIWELENYIPTVGFQRERHPIQLVSFGRQESYDAIRKFADQHKWACAHPRQCLAIAEDQTALYAKLSTRSCTIALTDPYLVGDDKEKYCFHIIFSEGKRVAEAVNMSRRNGYDWEWFAFVPAPGT